MVDNSKLSDNRVEQLKKEIEEEYEPVDNGVAVGGILLFFCIILTIFSPLIAISTLVTYIENLQNLSQLPDLYRVVIIDSMLYSMLVVYSIYAGTGLWSKRNDAVKTAKKFLVCNVFYSLLKSFYPYLADLPMETTALINSDTNQDLIRGFFFFLIWITYLIKSERVKKTYSNEFVAEDISEIPNPSYIEVEKKILEVDQSEGKYTKMKINGASTEDIIRQMSDDNLADDTKVWFLRKMFDLSVEDANKLITTEAEE